MSEPVLKKLINIPIWVQNELLIAHFIEVGQRNHFMLFGLLEGIHVHRRSYTFIHVNTR